ncbi:MULTISPECIES: hypothetical protein [Mycolicibacter]|jgi:hypothetical protein|uniref:Uncharacterized protein n=1 Tax=Mycolicibacter arupensis TaxID=342002 RepID=A0A5C7XV19_9MYCO|nr:MULTISPECIES: hypothetical protein [Mycolicibacter]TXI53389.1 MAG: hypothetical protein E6Q54_16555 [Mycolicibacter arupensis]
MTDNEIDLVDGTVLAYQASPHEGLVYVTVTGPDEDKPMILGFDHDDLAALNRARKELKRHRPEPDPGGILRVLNEASRLDSFIHDRVEYRYNSLEGKWLAWGRVDTDDDPEPGTTWTTDRKWW